MDFRDSEPYQLLVLCICRRRRVQVSIRKGWSGFEGGGGAATRASLLPCGSDPFLPSFVLLESTSGRGGGGIPLSDLLLGVEGAGVAGDSGRLAADKDDTCDVVVAWLGCGGAGVDVRLSTFTLVELASPSSRRGLFLGAMMRLCSWVGGEGCPGMVYFIINNKSGVRN